MTARIIALCNQKGGVGKTTTTLQDARAAARAGRRTLIVDADPQGNLTSVATAEPVEADQIGLADVLTARRPLELREVIVPGLWPGVDVVPTAPGNGLELVRDELTSTGAGRETRLRDALATVAEDYDIIFIDCGPSLDTLTVNALTAAHGIVVLTEADLFSANGLSKLLDTVDTVRSNYNPALQIVSLVVNHYEASTVRAREWVASLTTASAVRGLPAPFIIPKRVVIGDATDAGRGLDEWGTADATQLSEIYVEHFAAIEGAFA